MLFPEHCTLMDSSHCQISILGTAGGMEGTHLAGETVPTLRGPPQSLSATDWQLRSQVLAFAVSESDLSYVFS